MSDAIKSHIMPYYRNVFTTAPRCVMTSWIRSERLLKANRINKSM